MLLLKWPLAALRPCMASMGGCGGDDTELQGCTHRQGWIWGILAQQKEGAGRSRGVCAAGRSPRAPFRVQLSSQDRSNTACCGLAAVWLLQEELGLQCSSVGHVFLYMRAASFPKCRNSELHEAVPLMGLSKPVRKFVWALQCSFSLKTFLTFH